jgi:serine phosphatase RsbU (regulator of sigma subunit)
MLRLIGTDGTNYFAWDLTPGVYTLGRSPECQFVVPDKTVSRKHVQIDVAASGDRALITDLQSHNGTVVNGTRLSDPVSVKAGDNVMFGQVEFRLSTDGGAIAATSRPTATRLSTVEPEKSVFLSINEALKPLPSKVTDLPEFLPTLSEMARMLVLPEPKEEMLHRSLALVAKVIPAERLAVLFTSEDGSEVYTAASILPNNKDLGSFTLSRTIVKEILTNKNAILIGDPSDDSRFASQQSIIMSEIRSAIAVPLFDEGKVLGILYADTTNPRHRYSNDYLRLLATFGNIIAARLTNYTLLHDRQEKQLIERELQRASLIQRNLLAKESPVIDGYSIHAFQQQCQAVGGDLYDLASLHDGRVLFLLGDVSGKGMGAALLMANILASFRILHHEKDFSLARAVKQMSTLLFRYSMPSDFATLFAGIIDPRTHTLTFVNAGHNPPVLVRSDGSVEHLEPSGTMIGAFDFTDWTEDTRTFHAGDLLFIYSDGVPEAQGKDNQFGDERMERLIIDSRRDPLPMITERLMKDIESFVADTPRSDDITMLLLKRES